MLKKSYLITVFVFLSFSLTFAQVPQQINYQGYLTDAAGSPITGAVNIQFKIYNSTTTTTALWTDTYSVTVDNGRFSIILGSDPTNRIPYSVFNGDTRYLGIKVGADPEMSPRKELVSVGYSFRANEAGGGSVGDNLGNHTATQNLKMNNKWLSGDGGNEGVYVKSDGKVGIGKSSPAQKLDVSGTVQMTGFKMTTGAVNNRVLTSDASGNGTWKSVSAPGDNLGNHTATQNIKLNNKWLSNDGGSEGLKVTNTGHVQTSSTMDVLSWLWASGSIMSNSGYIMTGSSSTKPSYVANGDIYAKQDLHAGSGKITTGTPTSSAGNGDIVATDDVYADDRVYGNGGVYGYASGTNYSGYFSGNRGIYAKATQYNSIYSYGHSGNANTVLKYGSYGLKVEDATSYGVYAQCGSGTNAYAGYFQGGNGVIGYTTRNSSSNAGIIGRAQYTSTAYAGLFWGKVRVEGYLNKLGGGFEIDHPLDPANKYLVHSFVESPDMKNVYDGVVELGINGEATVELPDWFEALNKDFRYQLTCIGGFEPVYISKEISENSFQIAGGKSGMKISWQVTGIRKDAYADAHRIQVEVEKTADEMGKYLAPIEHGASETKGIYYEAKKQMDKQALKMEIEQGQLGDNK